MRQDRHTAVCLSNVFSEERPGYVLSKEILEREGPGKVFQTDCMKSSVRQLDRCGFGRMRQDRHTAVCLSNVFSEERPGYVLSKMDGRPAAPGFPPDPTTAEPQDDLPPGPEDNQETLSTRELDSSQATVHQEESPCEAEGTPEEETILLLDTLEEVDDSGTPSAPQSPRGVCPSPTAVAAPPWSQSEDSTSSSQDEERPSTGQDPARCRASECVQLVFGVDVKEVDPREHSYVLVPTLGLTCDGMLGDGQSMPKNGLLVMLLV
ncbi:Melanoma-associated antigen 8 [Camelus dromedarius]|uniref:Melanoma-associated antigen 8 n=1 Tax=Camelus dromedarius TaxID=9838 RepID=A0A5N4C2L0_CAMDR|nr:Melanoma-associated antigen 8 [Camelus dromedarius]